VRLTDVGELDPSFPDKIQCLRSVLCSVKQGTGSESQRTSAFCTRMIGFLLYRPKLVSDMISYNPFLSLASGIKDSSRWLLCDTV